MDLSDVEYFLRKKIKLRTCNKDLDFSNMTICRKHANKLGKDFTKTFGGKCWWPDHMKITSFKGRKPCINGVSIEWEESSFLFQVCSIILPMDATICARCNTEGLMPLKEKEGFIPSNFPSPHSQPIQVLDAGGDFEMTSVNSESSEEDDNFEPSSEESSQSQKPDSQEKRKSRTSALFQLIRSDGIDLPKMTKHILQNPYDPAPPRRKDRLHKLVGAGVSAVLHTVTEHKSDDAKIWNGVRDSGAVEKYLTSPSLPSQEMIDVILNYNHSTTKVGKIQALAPVAERYGFKNLSKFNKPKDNVMEVEQSKGEENDDDEGFDILTVDSNDLGGLFFIPAITEKMVIKATKHRRINGYSAAPMLIAQRFNWRVSQESVERIVDIALSPVFTDTIAYGITNVNVRTEDGLTKKVPVARTLRRFINADMIRMIKGILEAEGLEVPSDTFIQKVLNRLASSKMKEMAGVNSVHESAMLGFDTLKQLLIEIKATISQEQFDNLNKVLDTLKLYLKATFSGNLQFESDIAAHCVSHLCSDSQKDCFSNQCQIQHTNKCPFCEQLNETMDIFMALVTNHVETLEDEIKIDQLLEDVEQALKNIMKYKMDLVKAWIQRYEFQRKFEMLDETCVYITMDWSMKGKSKASTYILQTSAVRNVIGT